MSLYAPKSSRRPIDVEALKVALEHTGGDAMATALIIGCTAKLVRRHAELLGVKIVARSYEHWGRPLGPRRVYTDEAIAAALAQTGDDVDEAAQLLGCGKFTVYSYRSRAGLPRRTASTSQPWTPARIALLQSMAWATPRTPMYEMAKALGTTMSGIQTAMSRYGVTHQKRAESKGTVRQRDCMACSRPFMSEGSHNRQCQRCYSLACEVA